MTLYKITKQKKNIEENKIQRKKNYSKSSVSKKNNENIFLEQRQYFGQCCCCFLYCL